MNSLTSSTNDSTLGASFRDPAGFIYRDKNGIIKRQINQVGKDDYKQFMDAGLYDELVKKGYLVKHKETKDAIQTNAYVVIQPELIPVISYPFEWSFSQLKDAALLTLKIQKIALQHGMILKDASAYNIQFKDGKPIFIDTLSFEKYVEGNPWQAYRQYCQHFLAPLVLMSSVDLDMSQLLVTNIDGVPLELASKLLPRRTKLRPGIAMHIVMHGRAQKAKATEHKKVSKKVPKTSLLGILDSLNRTTKKLKHKKSSTEWGDYYNITNYTKKATDNKHKLVTKFATSIKAKTAVDIGGNDGTYSRVLTKLGIETICTDIDPIAVESNYLTLKKRKENLMLPLVVNLVNPGGAIGWANDERESISDRINVDLVMALAIIHHLAISNNLPFKKIAEYLSRFGSYLIIEFVPKGDSQVNKLLSTREDIFPEYDERHLKSEFGAYYKLIKEEKIAGTKRTLYLFKVKNGKTK